MEVGMMQYPPGDSRMIDKIVHQLKSQGIFDQFRKECLADVDTKPAYQNLHQRVEGSVTGFLASQVWRPDLNKNQLRDSLRKHIHDSGFLDIGVERIVDQVVNPKVKTVFVPQVEDVVYKYLGIEKPKKGKENQNVYVAPLTAENLARKEERKLPTLTDLLPKELEPISPESDTLKEKDDENSVEDEFTEDKEEEDSSPPFEPIEEVHSHLESSLDSHLSGISELTSHDSRHSDVSFMVSNNANNNSSTKLPILDFSNNDSQLSKVSSGSRLSIVSPAEHNAETNDESQQSKTSFHVSGQDTQMSTSMEFTKKDTDVVKSEENQTVKDISEDSSNYSNRLHIFTHDSSQFLSDDTSINIKPRKVEIDRQEKKQDENVEKKMDNFGKVGENKSDEILTEISEKNAEAFGNKSDENGNKQLIEKLETNVIERTDKKLDDKCEKKAEEILERKIGEKPNRVIDDMSDRKIIDESDEADDLYEKKFEEVSEEKRKSEGKYEIITEEQYENKIEEKLEKRLDDKPEKHIDEKPERKSEEKFTRKTDDRVEKKIDDKHENKLEEKFGRRIDDKGDKKQQQEDRCDKKLEEKHERRTEDKTERKLNEKLERKSDDKSEKRIEEKSEKRLEEKIERKTDERSERKLEEKSARKTDDRYGKKTDDKSEKRTNEKSDRKLDEKLEKKTEDKSERKNDTRSEKKGDDKHDKKQDRHKEDKEKSKDKRDEKKRFSSENRDTKKSDSSNHSSESDKKRSDKDKHKKERNDSRSKTEKSGRHDNKDSKEKIDKEKPKHEEKTEKDKIKPEEKTERDATKDKPKQEVKENKDEKEKRLEKDSSKEKSKKEDESSKQDSRKSKSDEKKEKLKPDERGRVKHDDKHKDRTKSESKDKADKEKSRHDDKSKDVSRSSSKDSKEKQKQERDKGKDTNNKSDEKKSKEKTKHDEKTSKSTEKGNVKKIDKKKDEIDSSKSSRTEHKSRDSGKKGKENKGKGTTDDHRIHRDKRSEDRRSADRDSNGTAQDRSLGSTASRTNASDSQRSQSRRDKTSSSGSGNSSGSGSGNSSGSGSNSNSSKSEGGGNSESSTASNQVIESSKSVDEQDLSQSKSTSPPSSLPFKKRPLSIQSEDEQSNDEHHSPSSTFCHKIKKPKIAANIFEVKKIMMLRKSLAKKERKQQKELKKNRIIKEGVKDIKSGKIITKPVIAKRRKIGDVEKSLRKEINTSLSNKQMPQDGENSPEIRYFESELIPNALSQSDSQFLAYVKRLVENDNLSEISTPSDTGSEISNLDDVIYLSDIDFDDIVAAELGAKIIETDRGREVVLDLQDDKHTCSKKLSIQSSTVPESFSVMGKASMSVTSHSSITSLTHTPVPINPSDFHTRTNMSERVESRPSSALSNWSDRSVDDVSTVGSAKRVLRQRSSSVASTTSNKSTIDKLEAASNGLTTGSQPQRKKVFSRKRAKKETAATPNMKPPETVTEKRELRRSRKPSTRYSSKLFASFTDENHFMQDEDMSCDIFTEERENVLDDSPPRYEYPKAKVILNDISKEISKRSSVSTETNKPSIPKFKISATITHADEDSSDREIVPEPSVRDHYDIISDNNNIDKGSSEDERGCGDGSMLNQDLILPTLRDLMVESGFRMKDDKSDILPSYLNVENLLVMENNVSNVVKSPSKENYESTNTIEKRRSKLGRSRRVGLGRPPPRRTAEQVGNDVNANRTGTPPSSNMADFVMPLSPESDVSASSGEAKKSLLDHKVGDGHAEPSPSHSEEKVGHMSNSRLGDPESRRSLRSGRKLCH
ncbi:biorientation of chromosomes in cell division protein 1-like 1 isoform X2 [Periplaneta americana]|uniref:biorientation of chromosomes in cell division protein 1-like 1 isoform X2 n=1 Tax=Periplaneta americana TaxID=6978 RepID=UPI0037E870FF